MCHLTQTLFNKKKRAGSERVNECLLPRCSKKEDACQPSNQERATYSTEGTLINTWQGLWEQTDNNESNVWHYRRPWWWWDCTTHTVTALAFLDYSYLSVSQILQLNTTKHKFWYFIVLLKHAIKASVAVTSVSKHSWCWITSNMMTNTNTFTQGLQQHSPSKHVYTLKCFQSFHSAVLLRMAAVYGITLPSVWNMHKCVNQATCHVHAGNTNVYIPNKEVEQPPLNQVKVEKTHFFAKQYLGSL